MKNEIGIGIIDIYEQEDFEKRGKINWDDYTRRVKTKYFYCFCDGK